MAKAKSNTIMIEEALVPVEEFPYEIPENWCWTRVKYVADVVTGSTPIKKHDEYYGGTFPFFKPADLDAEDNVIDATEYLSEEGKMVSRIIPRLSTAVCCIGTIGKSGLLQIEGTTNQQINSMIPHINPLYVYYYSKTNEFVNELWEKSTSTTISMVNKSNMESNTIPLPPLAEQQRIVERIESLFSKLDEAKEKAQEALSNSSERCAAILKDVFNGALSKKWREENNADLESWKKIPFEDCIVKIQNGLSKRSGKEGEAIPVLRLVNLGDDDFDISDLREIRLTKKEQNSYILEPDDIVMIRVNGSRDNVGRQLIIKEKTNWAFCDHIIRIKVSDLLVPEFLVMFSKTDEYRYYIEEHMVSSAGQNTISRKGLSDLSIYAPSVEEQTYLVKISDKLLTKERIIKDKIAELFEMIELMKKSILAKAFRGELGTNDLAEESSMDLLKKIID